MITYMPRTSSMFFSLFLTVYLSIAPAWGFFGHQMISRLAVFSLPREMYPFFRERIQHLSRLSVKPDQRRYAVPWEAQRHYLDMDAYPDSVVQYWSENPHYSDSIDAAFRKEHGDLPRQVMVHKFLLTQAMMAGDGERILALAAEVSHYISDAHVPLHTTSNYDGQLTGQPGIHGLWESRIPELFFDEYELYVDKASYIEDPYAEIWLTLFESHRLVDSVLYLERELSEKMGNSMMSHDSRGRQVLRQFSNEYAGAYQEILNGMIQKRMKDAVQRVSDFWYTCWVDAGMPILVSHDSPSPDTLILPAGNIPSDHRTSLHH